MNVIEESLFKTGAIRCSNEGAPFWYTSGTIGPFFINTHFLYGGENESNLLLDFIDKNISDKSDFPARLTKTVTDFYTNNELFNKAINLFYDEIKINPSFQDASYISGGERRDWIFSIPISYLSDKPHLFIFKDLSVYSTEKKIEDVRNSKVAHIADLITQASSYERAWIPAIKKINGEIVFSGSIVDRMQGGAEFLKKSGIESYSSVFINDSFFNNAKNAALITENQYQSIKDFTRNSIEYGKSFLTINIDFLKESLNSTNKSTKDKATRCVSENPYSINFDSFGIKI
ncbi:MAG TPA: orotate phosphoribosyltransferase [Spirochaetota bacterium]|nr:orotate phosphoribosyltransferase [Spirochaetota bacterium]